MRNVRTNLIDNINYSHPDLSTPAEDNCQDVISDDFNTEFIENINKNLTDVEDNMITEEDPENFNEGRIVC